MEGAKAVLLALAFLSAQLILVLSSPATAPAFLWSPKHYGSSEFDVKEFVNYQTVSPKDLARSVLSEGCWSSIVCAEDKRHEHVDIALIFVGRKLQSSDISKAKNQDSALLDLLKSCFSKSNISMAFPYVAISDEKNTMENSLVSAFVESCGHELAVNYIAYLPPFQDFVGSRMKARVSGKTDLIVFSYGDLENQDVRQSEGDLLSELVTFLEKSGATYSVLYASDPDRGLQYTAHLAMSRLLAEHTLGNAPVNSAHCDRVCQIKSSLLEGAFVGLVLLIILISGLCCMMGIDTPARFETPPES